MHKLYLENFIYHFHLISFLHTKVLLQSGTDLNVLNILVLQMWIFLIFILIFSSKNMYLKITYVFPFPRSTENSEAEITACCIDKNLFILIFGNQNFQINIIYVILSQVFIINSIFSRQKM